MAPEPLHPDPQAARRSLHRVARSALLSVLLGFAVQAVVLLISL